jgi:hypothetical protein
MIQVLLNKTKEKIVIVAGIKKRYKQNSIGNRKQHSKTIPTSHISVDATGRELWICKHHIRSVTASE